MAAPTVPEELVRVGLPGIQWEAGRDKSALNEGVDLQHMVETMNDFVKQRDFESLIISCKATGVSTLLPLLIADLIEEDIYDARDLAMRIAAEGESFADPASVCEVFLAKRCKNSTAKEQRQVASDFVLKVFYRGDVSNDVEFFAVTNRFYLWRVQTQYCMLRQSVDLWRTAVGHLVHSPSNFLSEVPKLCANLHPLDAKQAAVAVLALTETSKHTEIVIKILQAMLQSATKHAGSATRNLSRQGDEMDEDRVRVSFQKSLLLASVRCKLSTERFRKIVSTLDDEAAVKLREDLIPLCAQAGLLHEVLVLHETNGNPAEAFQFAKEHANAFGGIEWVRDYWHRLGLAPKKKTPLTTEKHVHKVHVRRPADAWLLPSQKPELQRFQRRPFSSFSQQQHTSMCSDSAGRPSNGSTQSASSAFSRSTPPRRRPASAFAHTRTVPSDVGYRENRSLHRPRSALGVPGVN